MMKRDEYLDRRNDFNGPSDKEGKRNYPKRPQHVSINDSQPSNEK